MAKISGWIFMAVGAIVSLFSRYIQKKGGEGLDLFFWAGVIMIGIGIFKTVSGFILKEKQSEEEKERVQGKQFKFGFNKELEGIDTKELLKEKEQAVKSIQSASIIVCPSCGTKHYSNSNFCHMCGNNLK